MFLTVLCAVSFGNTALVVAMTILAAVDIIVFMIIRAKHSYTLVTFGIGVLVACLLFLNTEYRHRLTLTMCGEGCNINAVVVSSPDFNRDNARFYVKARLKTIDSQKAYGKIRISFSKSKDSVNPENLSIGDEITFDSYVYAIGSSDKTVHNSFTASAVYLGGYQIENLTVMQPEIRPVGYYTDRLKRAITDKISFDFDNKTAGLVIGILTGDKEYCDEEVYRNFKTSGAAHILAVSGLHMSIWVSAFGALFEKMKRKSRLSYFLILLFVVLTVFVADFTPSVCRAALMSSLFLIGRIIGEKDDPLNSLGFAMVCLLCSNVFVIHSISFQLTFACMFSIIAVSVPVYNRFEKFINEKLRIAEKYRKILCTVSSGVIISVTVTLFTFPVSAWHFGYVSALSPITNMLIIPLCAPLMVLSLVYLLLSFIPSVSHVLGFCIRIICEYMVKVTESVSSSSVAVVTTGEDATVTWAFIMLAVGLIFVLYRFAYRRYARLVSLVLVIFVVFSSFKSVNRTVDEYSIRLIENENDLTAVLIYNRKAVVIGVYDRYYFTEELESVVECENSEVVAVVPTENTEDRFLDYICADLDTDNIILTGESVVLFDRVKVENRGSYATIYGNNKTVTVIYKDDLQPIEDCDIIVSCNKVVCFDEGVIYDDISLRYGTVRVNSDGEVKVRGERFWRNLTKKSLKLT